MFYNIFMNKVTIADEKTDHRRGVDHIGVGIVALIHDGQGNLLLMKRGARARDEQGRWDVCGGAIEFGESIDEAVRREVMEELCTEALDIDFLSVYDAHRIHEGHKTHWVQVVHAVRVDPKTVKIGEPHKIDGLAWHTSKDLPEPLHSMFHKSLELAIKHGILK